MGCDCGPGRRGRSLAPRASEQIAEASSSTAADDRADRPGAPAVRGSGQVGHVVAAEREGGGRDLATKLAGRAAAGDGARPSRFSGLLRRELARRIAALGDHRLISPGDVQVPETHRSAPS